MKLTLSKQAQADILNILRYSALQWDIDRAERYVRGLRGKLALLIDNPMIGASLGKVRPGLRRYPYMSHVAYYRVSRSEIRVLRILHQQMLVDRHLR